MTSEILSGCAEHPMMDRIESPSYEYDEPCYWDEEELNTHDWGAWGHALVRVYIYMYIYIYIYIYVIVAFKKRHHEFVSHTSCIHMHDS